MVVRINPRNDANNNEGFWICMMANLISLAICNMTKVQTSHYKPLETHLQGL